MTNAFKILDLLLESPLFQGVQREVLSRHLSMVNCRTLKKGDVLLSPRQHNDLIYVILSGRLSVHLNQPDDVPIALFGQGECVGEISLLDDGLVSAYVIAETDCNLLTIDHVSVWALINDSHRAALNMLSILTRRIRVSDQLIVESMEQQQGYEKTNLIDDLTGLYNHHWVNEAFHKQIRRSSMNNKPCTLILLNVDGFKQFNEQYGDLGGDQALRTIAQTMLDCMRPNDMAARYHSEKFAILLPNTPLAEGNIAAERLRTNVAQKNIVVPSGDVLPSVTVSLGLSETCANDTLEQLISRAESAVLEAKAAGGNCTKL